MTRNFWLGLTGVIGLVLIANLAHAQNYTATSGLNPDAYRALESPYDEGKLRSLKPYGFDHVKLVKNRDKALVSENYGSSDGHMAALIKRNADTGHVESIVVDLKMANGHRLHYVWDLVSRNFNACGSTGKCRVSVIKQCEAVDAKFSDVLRDVCPFLAEVVIIPKEPTAGASPGASPAPSPSPSHHTRLIFKH